MEEVIDAIYIFRRIYLNIDKSHLNKSKKTLWLENGRSSIYIAWIKKDEKWQVHFRLANVLSYDKNCYSDLCIYLDEEELSYMFGLKEILGDDKTKKMILYITATYFVRFENYLGIFSRDRRPVASLSLNEYIKGAVKKLLEL